MGRVQYLFDFAFAPFRGPHLLVRGDSDDPPVATRYNPAPVEVQTDGLEAINAEVRYPSPVPGAWLTGS